jgi:toxin ParE1/3/4
VSHRVLFSPEALVDLEAIYDCIAEAGHPARAAAFVDRIERYCRGFSDFPERGARRDEIRPGLRTIGFERRLTVAFHVDAAAVIIDRLLYGGRDWEATLGPETPDD